MGKPELLEPRRQLAADLAEIRRFAGPNPDLDYMAGLLLENFHAGRYGAASHAAPGVPDVLKSRTPEELRAYPCLTKEQIQGAIEQGERDRYAALHPTAPAPAPAPGEPRGDE